MRWLVSGGVRSCELAHRILNDMVMMIGVSVCVSCSGISS